MPHQAPPTPREYKCKTCGSNATAIPRLYINPHRMSLNRGAEPWTILYFLPLCERHFSLLSAGHLMEKNFDRDAVEIGMRKRNALPDFNNCTIGRVSRYDVDWNDAGGMADRIRRN